MKINAIYALQCHLVTNFNEYFEKLQNHVLHTCNNYVYIKTQSYVLLMALMLLIMGTRRKFLHCQLAI